MSGVSAKRVSELLDGTRAERQAQFALAVSGLNAASERTERTCIEELSIKVSQALRSYVILHGAFARPAKQELMEVAVLKADDRTLDCYRSLVRCDIPEKAEELAEDSSSTGVSSGENSSAPAPDELFAHLNRTFSLEEATVVMWAGMAYRLHRYARQKRLTYLDSRTQVIDLQMAVLMHFNLKTSQCKDPRSVIRLLNLTPEADCFARGSLPFVHAMNALMGQLIQDGWTPESTPAAVTIGCDIDEQSEQMRIERWEQIRERQNNLGVERRPIPDITPAFILLDGEYVSTRNERVSSLIELAVVVAYRQEHQGRSAYELAGKPFSSLVQFHQVEDTHPYAWEMTGIDPNEVRTAPSLPRVMAGMVAAAPWERGVLVTWGPDDAAIITQNCVKAGIPSPISEVPLIDLQRAFSRFYDLGPQQVGLQNAALFVSMDTSRMDLHRAATDTLVTWHVLERMLADGWTPLWRPWHRQKVKVV